jgi:imidazolonepropionase-like amidohydrolase
LRASCLERAPAANTEPDAQHSSSPAALRDYVKTMAEQGIDSIKFQLSSDDAFKPNGSEYVTYSDEEVAAIGEQARASNVMLTCHAQAAHSIKLAVKNGFRILYHCSLADDEALDMIEAKRLHAHRSAGGRHQTRRRTDGQRRIDRPIEARLSRRRVGGERRSDAGCHRAAGSQQSESNHEGWGVLQAADRSEDQRRDSIKKAGLPCDKPVFHHLLKIVVLI